MFLLRDLPVIDGKQFVHAITSGHRRFWIGSVLAAARTGVWLAPPNYDELSSFFARILRGWDCGIALKRQPQTPDLRGFPILPHDDIDNRICVFDPAECQRFVELLDLLLQLQPTFGSPPGLGPQDDEFDWNMYACERLTEFMRLRELLVKEMHLVTFIG